MTAMRLVLAGHPLTSEPFSGAPMNAVTSSAVPSASELSPSLHDTYFHDCYQVDADQTDLSALELYLMLIAQTPAWVHFLMAVRNKIAPWFGIKDAGRFDAKDPAKPASDYRIGDRIGVFVLTSVSDDEVVLGESDRHLTVHVSICKVKRDGRASIAVSTVVHIHNALGRLYMFFVTPVHKIIAPAVLSRARWEAQAIQVLP